MNTTPEALIQTGVAQWANIQAADPDHTLALIGSVFRGIAGPEANLVMPWGNSPLPPLHIVVRAGATDTLLEPLLHPPRRLNRLILDTMSGINRNMLDYTHFGTFATDPARANINARIESVALNELRERAASSREAEISSSIDLSPSSSTVRRESILRASLLLEDARFDILKQLLLGCHRLSALGILQLTPALDASDPERQLANLIELLDGCEILIPQTRKTLGIEHHRRGTLHAIIRADRSAWERLYSQAPRLVERALLIDKGTPSQFSLQTDCAAAFHQAYTSSIKTLFTTRRNGSPVEVGFSDSNAAIQFQKCLVDYSVVCDDLSHEIGSFVRCLPASLAWTLIILSRHLDRQYHPPDDTQIVEASLAVSRRLLDNHCQSLDAMESASRQASMLTLAYQLVKKVKAKQPVLERDLVRSFNNQRVERYRPVIEILVDAEVLEISPDRLLRLGAKNLEEIQSSLPLPPRLKGPE